LKEINAMNKWNQLLAALDAAHGFPNQTSSTFKRVGQGYDQKTGEHVIRLEYRVRVDPGQYVTETPLLAEINARIR
jgi:hypothetical protein